MLDSIISGIKSQAIGAITGQTGATASQAEASVPIAQESIKEGLMGAATSGNFGGITDMFKSAAGGGGGMASLAKNAVYMSIATKFISKLTGSLGLGDGVANKISSVALPMIIGKVGADVTKDGGSSMDLGSITKLVGGGAAGGLGNMVKGFMG